MSETRNMPPLTEDRPESEQAQPPVWRRRYVRHVLWTGSGLLFLLIAGIVCLYFWASSSTFENIVRKRLIARVEAATGGRAEIAAFHWNLLKLQAEADGLVLHGREAQGERPYAQLASLRVDLDVLGFWSPRILLRSLEIEQPEIHLIVYPDGTTNQPRPRKRTESHPLDTLFDLQANHVEVEHGGFDYDNRADANDFQDRHIPLDFAANDVSLLLKYIPAGIKTPESYHLDAGIGDLRLTRGPTARPEAPPVQGLMRAAVDFTRNAAYLRSLQVTAHSKGTKDRILNISGQLVDFAHPHWKAQAQGELDLKIMEPATGYPDTPEGIARLNLTAEGEDGQFTIDGTVHADGAAYVGNGVNARGVVLDARVHADPLRLQITNVTARLRPGGQLEGEVLLDHWIAPLAATPVISAAIASPKRGKNGKKQASAEPASPVVRPPDNLLHTDGKVNAYFRNVTLDTLLDMVSEPPYQRLGLRALLNGPSNAVWTNGDARTLAVSANFKLSPPAQGFSGEIATTGAVDATYRHKNGAVELRNLEVTMPSSEITAHGTLGAYPVTSPTEIDIHFHSHDLGDFDKVLRDLGLSRRGTSGTAALPVSLSGQADFQGNWTGSLVDPRLSGEFSGSNLSVEMPMGENAGQPRLIHWDSLEADGSYSAAKIAIDHSTFRRGDASISLAGTLTSAGNPSGTRGRPGFGANSLLHANLHATGVNSEDLAPFLSHELPVQGRISTQLSLDGPVDRLNGSGWIQVDSGSLYGEPLRKARAQGRIQDQIVQVDSLALDLDAGTVTAAGNYDINARRFQVNARGSGIDVARINRLKNSGVQMAGRMEFSASGSGTFDDPNVQGRANLTGLTINGDRLGAMDIVVRTANRDIIYDISSQLEAAQLKAHGQTALHDENGTHATLSFSRFNIGALLQMAHVNGLTGESDLEGSMTVVGPLAKPDQMRGEAKIDQLAVTVAGVHLRSEGGLHATLANSRISLDPLHVTGEQTDLHVQGGLNLLDKKQLDLAANGSINLKLAETIDPDLTASGITRFRVEAHGPLASPNLTGRIDFENASLALEDLPNSLSQLHGTLEFNQNRLEVKSLTAMSGGGLLSVSGYLAYQHGLYADLALKGKSIRIRYPQGVSSAADINLQLQGPQNNLLLSGNVLITRFTISPEMDFVALATQAGKSQSITPANAPRNHVRLDVRIQSSPQLNFQNAYAKLAGDVDLRLRGTIANPSLLGRVSITEGSATIAGTRYELQRGEITFTNPVRIQPIVDLNAMAHVEDYDITLGLHGPVDQMTVTYRSDPPLPETDVLALLTLGRTQDQQRLYTQQQEQLATNPTTDALLGGALNATVSSRVQKLFGAGSVKVDPNYLGTLGNSTTRITVEEQLGKNLTLTYATDVDTTAQQLLQAEIAINRHVSLLVARDESGVFSMVLKATRRFR